MGNRKSYPSDSSTDAVSKVAYTMIRFLTTVTETPNVFLSIVLALLLTLFAYYIISHRRARNLSKSNSLLYAGPQRPEKSK